MAVLTSIGAKWSIAVETVKGTRPTIFTHIPKVYECEMPELTPNTADATSYDNLVNTSSVPILSDTSSNFSLTARYTSDEEAETVWNAAVADFEAGKATGLGCWLCLDIKDAKNVYFFPIVPVETQLPADLPLNDVVSIAMNYTLAGDIVKSATRPTYSA